MSPLNILIGGEIFRTLREGKYCYVDKTQFIEELLGPNRAQVSLITRPRRFGKTLTMSMLQEFFDIRKDSRALFAGLNISRNKELCAQWQNNAPTIFITLKGVEGSTFSHAQEKFVQILRRACSQSDYLFTSDRVRREDKKTIESLNKDKPSISCLEDSLFSLCSALQAYWEKPVILLIDEYDVPLNFASQNGYFPEMMRLMRTLLGEALKTNTALQFAVLTGCLRIAKESIFTGLNNFMCYSVSDAEYAEIFGFTEAEVDSLLDAAKLTHKKDEFTDWYDGYHFGDGKDIYCPWDILAHIVRLQKNPHAAPQAYWNNTSSNTIVRTLVSNAAAEARDKIEALLSGEAIEEKLIEDVTFDSIYEDENSIWTMLYLTGYLTKAENQTSFERTALVIPNKEVRIIFTDTVSKWFDESVKKMDLIPLVRALWAGDAVAVQKILCDILYDTISYFDNTESFYHGFLTGLLRGAGLVIKSNRESGLGRSDILVEDGKNKRALIFELKRAETYEELRDNVTKALAQINKKKYTFGLAPQITTVLQYGIAFWKKECCVQLGQ